MRLYSVRHTTCLCVPVRTSILTACRRSSVSHAALERYARAERWDRIARALHGRTEVAAKGRWQYLQANPTSNAALPPRSGATKRSRATLNEDTAAHGYRPHGVSLICPCLVSGGELLNGDNMFARCQERLHSRRAGLLVSIVRW